MKRIFIAVDISDDARRVAALHLEKLRQEYSDVRVSWVRPENIHITVKFLGDVNDVQIERIASRLKHVASEADVFEVSLGKPNVFGRRTLVIGVEDHRGHFAALNHLIEIECEKLGFEAENRPFRPHLTIGRMRNQKGTSALIFAHRNAKIEPVSFEINSIVLYESQRHSNGSDYSPLGKFLLATTSLTRLMRTVY